MNNKIIPVTLALVDDSERKRLEGIIANNFMVRLQDEDAEDMGVLIYEPGDDAAADMPHIIQALETGQAHDVYLAGEQADPELLIMAMRYGIREFLKYPVSEEDFRAAIMRTAIRESLEETECETKGRVIAVLGGKPGLGTTTLAVNLATALATANPGQTALLDLRVPVGETPYFLDLEYTYTWGDLLKDVSRLDATYLQSVLARHDSGLSVLPGPQGEGRPNEQSLFMLLEQLRVGFGDVVVDTAFPDDEHLPKEVEQADVILIVLELTLPSLARTVRLVEAIRDQDPDAERRMVLVANKVAKDSSIGIPEAEEALGRKITWVLPLDGPAASGAVNQGAPVITAHPKSALSKAIHKIAAHYGQGMVQSAEPKAKKSLLGSLFKKKGAEVQS